MSDPLSDKCLYCGSPAVLDDAWFCGDCWGEYERESLEGMNEKLRAIGFTPISEEREL